MRRLCSVAVVIAVLVSAIGPGAGIDSGCRTCAPGCPMHARKVGCHHAKDMGCHRGAPATGLRSACRHAQDPAVGPSMVLRGIMPVRATAAPRLEVRNTTDAPSDLVTRPLPEPPTAPPRSSLV